MVAEMCIFEMINRKRHSHHGKPGPVEEVKRAVTDREEEEVISHSEINQKIIENDDVETMSSSELGELSEEIEAVDKGEESPKPKGNRPNLKGVQAKKQLIAGRTEENKDSDDEEDETESGTEINDESDEEAIPEPKGKSSKKGSVGMKNEGMAMKSGGSKKGSEGSRPEPKGKSRKGKGGKKSKGGKRKGKKGQKKKN